MMAFFLPLYTRNALQRALCKGNIQGYRAELCWEIARCSSDHNLVKFPKSFQVFGLQGLKSENTMTWHTSVGDRCLAGAEGTLFAETLIGMIDLANGSEEKWLNYGTPLVDGQFQNLADNQKYQVLYEVAKELLFATTEVPPATAIKDGAIYYPYAWLKQEFQEVEIGESVWGQKILDAIAECAPSDDDDEDEDTSWPTLGCMDEDLWGNAIDYLADRILWDRDFEMYEDFGYLPPGQAAGEMERMDIDPNYFKPWDKRALPKAQQKLEELLLSFDPEA